MHGVTDGEARQMGGACIELHKGDWPPRSRRGEGRVNHPVPTCPISSLTHFTKDSPHLDISLGSGIPAANFMAWTPTTVSLTPPVVVEAVEPDEDSESGSSAAAAAAAAAAASAAPVMLDPATVTRRVKRKSLKAIRDQAAASAAAVAAAASSTTTGGNTVTA